ncbi:META domain-containing protein [Bdellovibrio bacteriovorus]|uniref:META domain-containing protein n=1 Tax=Bdellovibrio bacteriovorus TaxID=959 RepID=UPI003A801297
MNKITLLSLICLSMWGCAHSETTSEEISMQNNQAPAANFKDIRWELVELMGQPVKYANADSQKVYIQFNGGDNRVNGSDGCNSFTGAYEETPGQRLFISKLASTKKFCVKMPTEDNFAEVLQGVDNYTVDGDNLSLNKARMAPLARFKAVSK